MKKYITSIILTLALVSVHSQNHEKAKEILDQVSAKTKSYPSIKADFSFSMENLQEGISELYDGSIILKDTKYKVSLMGFDTYYDGSVLYTHMIDAEEVNITEPDPDDEETLNPATIFSLYEEGYKFNYVGDGVADGKPCHEIDLYPENRDKPYSRIKLLIFKDNLHLYSLRQVGKDGDNYTVIVKNMVTTEEVDDSHFVFNTAANPNIDVIDMR